MSVLGPGSPALLVPVPEAGPVVGDVRLRYDPTAVLGIPAHVTLIAPFLPADEVDDGVLADLRELFARVPAFPFRVDGLGGFAGVLWLALDPSEPFLGLMRLL